MKNSIGNGTRDFLASSAVPQPTAPQRAPVSTLQAFPSYIRLNFGSDRISQ